MSQSPSEIRTVNFGVSDWVQGKSDQRSATGTGEVRQVHSEEGHGVLYGSLKSEGKCSYAVTPATSKSVNFYT